MLQNEIELLKKIEHPNIAQIYEYYEDEKSIYISFFIHFFNILNNDEFYSDIMFIFNKKCF